MPNELWRVAVLLCGLAGAGCAASPPPRPTVEVFGPIVPDPVRRGTAVPEAPRPKPSDPAAEAARQLDEIKARLDREP